MTDKETALYRHFVKQLASEVGVTAAHWRVMVSRGVVPDGWHFKLFLKAEALGIRLNPPDFILAKGKRK